MGLLDTLKELLGMRDTVDANKDNKLDLDFRKNTSEFEQFTDTNKDDSIDTTDTTTWSDVADTEKDGELSADGTGAILNEKIDRK